MIRMIPKWYKWYENDTKMILMIHEMIRKWYEWYMKWYEWYKNDTKMIRMLWKWYQNDMNNTKWYVAVCTYEFSTCVVCTVTMFYNLIKFGRLQICVTCTAYESCILLHDVQFTNFVQHLSHKNVRARVVSGWIGLELRVKLGLVN